MRETPQAAHAAAYIQDDLAHLMHPLYHPTDHQHPRIWVKGEGALLTDMEGYTFIDGLSGLWNVHIGHGRRELAEAAMRQMSTLAYASAYTGSTNLRTIELANRLSQITYPSINTFFFTSGGAESTESSFKTARYYWKLRGKPDKVKFISRIYGYHGVTMAAGSATGIAGYWAMFEPRVPHFSHIESPYPYRFTGGDEHTSPGVAAANLLEAAILREGADTVAGFIAEPIQGAGGVIVPQPDYFARIREICDQYDVLLIADEVITGFGRTGRWFGLEHFGIEPDIMQFAKGITSGYVPLGGIGVSDTIRETLYNTPASSKYMHAYTYSGHPTTCAVALANLDVIVQEGLVERAAEVGAYLQEQLQSLYEIEHVGDVRGIGMIAGVELVANRETKEQFPPASGFTKHLARELLERGLFTRIVRDIICIAPPLVTTHAQIDQIVAIIREAVPAAVAATYA